LTFQKLNVFIVGDSGTGKSTLVLAAVICFIYPSVNGTLVVLVL